MPLVDRLRDMGQKRCSAYARLVAPSIHFREVKSQFFSQVDPASRHPRKVADDRRSLFQRRGWPPGVDILLCLEGPWRHT